MGETKKRRPKEPEKGRPEDTNKGDEKLQIDPSSEDC